MSATNIPIYPGSNSFFPGMTPFGFQGHMGFQGARGFQGGGGGFQGQVVTNGAFNLYQGQYLLTIEGGKITAISEPGTY